MLKPFSMGTIALAVAALMGCSSADDDDSNTSADTLNQAIRVGGNGDETITAGKVGLDGKEISSYISTISVQQVSERQLQASMVQIDLNNFDDDSDYNNDKPDHWVDDQSLEAIEVANDILCELDQTGYAKSAVVNQGPYLAKVDVGLCENEDKGQNIGASQKEASQLEKVPQYEFWTVDSMVSDDATQPQVVHFWIPKDDLCDYDCPDEMSGMIVAKMVIYEQKSAQYPDGLFTLNFVFLPFDADTKQVDLSAEPIMQGFLKTFVNSDDDIMTTFMNTSTMMGSELAMQERMIFSHSVDGTTGMGTLSMAYPELVGNKLETVNKKLHLAYSKNFLSEKINDTPKCFDRQDVKYNADHYVMYDAAGAQIYLQTGLSLVHDPSGQYDQDSNLHHAWAGHWGVHFDQGHSDQNAIQMTDQMTFRKFDYETGMPDTQEYRLSMKPGKMQKRERTEIALNQLQDESFYQNQCDASGKCHSRRVTYDGQKFLIEAQEEYNTQTGSVKWNDFETPVELVFEDLQQPLLELHSHSANAYIQVHNICKNDSWQENQMRFTCAEADVNLAAAKVFASTYMDVEMNSVQAHELNGAALICFQGCPDANKVGQSVNSWEDFHQDMNEHAYTFDVTKMVLHETASNKDVVYPNDGQGDALWSGMLMLDNQTNRDHLKCPDDPNQNCPWLAESRISESYFWQTGKKPWSKLMSLQQNNVDVTFDKPFHFTYQHGNKNFYLKYHGMGHIEGLPYHCEDPIYGKKVSCDKPDVRWVTNMNIPAGTQITYKDAQNQDQNAVLKPLHYVYMLKQVDTQKCVDDGVKLKDYSASLPTTDGWINPIVIGKNPTANLEIKVETGHVVTN